MKATLTATMHARDRVTAAFSHREADRMPRYDYFWPEFAEHWRRAKALPPGADPYRYYGIDLRVIQPDVAPRLGGDILLESTENHDLWLDGWGSVQKRLHGGTSFPHPVAFALTSPADLHSLHCDPAADDRRYSEFTAKARELWHDFALFVEVKGPYTCLWRLLGPERSLYLMIDDPDAAAAVALTMTELQTAIALEALRRCPDGLGVLIDEDVAYNTGMLFSPSSYKAVFYPALCRMASQLKTAGSRFIIFHSDGDCTPMIPLLIDARIDAIHPLEARAGIDAVNLKRRYGDALVLIGNMDNTGVLRAGNDDDITREVRRKLAAGAGGGYITGSHSIGDDVPIENYDYYIRALDTYGSYPLYL